MNIDRAKEIVREASHVIRPAAYRVAGKTLAIRVEELEVDVKRLADLLATRASLMEESMEEIEKLTAATKTAKLSNPQNPKD